MMKIGTDISEAVNRLGQGRLVAMPTETVYGLAANACDDDAIRRIYETKGRPSYNPLITHVASKEAAQQLVQWNDHAEILSNAFWPGPLTFVLKRSAECSVSNLASAGLDTLAIRMPAHPIARELIAASDFPLAAPSANLSGCVTATSAQHVADDFVNEDIYVLEAGNTDIGLESTVIDLSVEVPTMLRPGNVTHTELEGALGKRVLRASDENDTPSSPGMLSKHYAPRAELRLNATHVDEGEALLAFGKPLKGAVLTINLSEKGDVQEASSRLFSALRELDAKEAHHVAVMPIPSDGVGEAINDRLRRAATPKQS